MEALRVEGLCKQYPAFALKNVSFSMEAGTIMGFIGRNGAGKTTTLKSMLRLVHPDAGSVTVCGLDTAEDEMAVKACIGFVTGTAAYYPRKRLGQLTAATRRFYPDWDEARYQDCLRRFALDEGKHVSELSEGMKVKYQLALAMSHHAQLLILDEPTSGLDPAARDDLLGLFLELVAQDGASVLFSTHITSDLEACADTITYIRNGEIFASEPRRAFTERYRYLRCDEAKLPPELAAKLIAPRRHQGEIEGLLLAAEAPEAGVPATLEQIMVHLEREVEA